MARAVSARDREHVLAHTAGLWDDVRGERIFMTGGTGFVGTWLVESFVAANAAYDLGATVIVLSRDPQRFAARAPHLAGDPAVRLVVGDAVDFTPPDGRFAFVVHAATHRYDGEETAAPLRSFDRDAAATRRVLDFARHAATRRFLFTSSGAVYGSQPAELSRVSETYPGGPDPTAARTAYGHGKRLAEFACASYARAFGFDAVIGRLFAFVGPHLPPGFAVGDFLDDILAGRAIRIGGDGTAVRSYLYAADLAIWLWTLLLRGSPGRAYNVGSAQAVSIRRLAELMVAELAPGTAIEVERGSRPGAAGARYVPSIARAESELGLRVHVPLRDALRRTYDFARGPQAGGAG